MTGSGRNLRISSSESETSETDALLHLVRKLRWIGSEQEAQEAQRELRRRAPTGRVLSIPIETD